MQQQLGRYQILEEIAAGGQGTVYRAFDPDTRQIVALKVLHPTLSGDSSYIERFRREASLAASIDHPNVVKIFEVGQDGDRHFMALEFVPESLARVIETGPQMQIATAAQFGVEVADGLSAAHALGIVHRDVKPQNVLIGADGTAKVTDFGIARAESLTTMTATGAVMGTPHYMSPEQSRGERADARSDVYSLGCMVYQMLAGQVPFKGDTPVAVLRQQIDDQPRRLRELRRDLPRRLEAVVERSMAKDADRRYQSTAEMAQALRAAVPGLAEPVQGKQREAAPAPGPAAPREESAPGAGGRGIRRFIYGVAFVSVAAAAVLGGFLLASQDTPAEVGVQNPVGEPTRTGLAPTPAPPAELAAVSQGHTNGVSAVGGLPTTPTPTQIPTQAQSSVQSQSPTAGGTASNVLFEDSFESGILQAGWRISQAHDAAPGAGWELVLEDGLHQLVGKGHAHADIGDEEWVDYRIEARLKVVEGLTSLNLRMGYPGRYMLMLPDLNLAIRRPSLAGETVHTDVPVTSSINLEPGTWYDLWVVLSGGRIEVYVDGELALAYTDPEPLPGGGVGFESHETDSVFRLQSVVVLGGKDLFPASGVPTDGLVGYWPAEGNADDIVGGNHGTLLNGATFAPGIVGQAFRFDGLDDGTRATKRYWE